MERSLIGLSSLFAILMKRSVFWQLKIVQQLLYYLTKAKGISSSKIFRWAYVGFNLTSGCTFAMGLRGGTPNTEELLEYMALIQKWEQPGSIILSNSHSTLEQAKNSQALVRLIYHFICPETPYISEMWTDIAQAISRDIDV